MPSQKKACALPQLARYGAVFVLSFYMSTVFQTYQLVSDKKQDSMGKRIEAVPQYEPRNINFGAPSNTDGVSIAKQVPTANGVADETSCFNRTRVKCTQYYEATQRSRTLKGRFGPLRIAAFSRLWPPPVHNNGGMQFHAQHLYSQMAALGHTVHVFVTTGPRNGVSSLSFLVDKRTLALTRLGDDDWKTNDKVHLVLHLVPSEKNREYSVLWHENCLSLFQELHAEKPFDVAHSESWAGVPNMYQIGVPMAVTWHGSMMDWFRNEINLIVHNFRLKHRMVSKSNAKRMEELGSSVAYEAYQLLAIQHHIVISESAADGLVDANLIEPERVHLIYNGVSPANFYPDDAVRSSRQKFIQKHQIPESAFLVGCGGRLVKIKGHAQLSRAIDLVMEKHDDVYLLVAGDGDDAHIYMNLINKGRSRIKMLGMLSQDDLGDFYRSIDVFVDPFYQHHGLNTVMIEAVLSGAPLIATRLASAKTTVPCAEFGWTFALGSKTELAEAIQEARSAFLTNTSNLRVIGQNARERALQLFTTDVMAARYEEVMYKALQSKAESVAPLTGRIVCRKTYPSMCYREIAPSD